MIIAILNCDKKYGIGKRNGLLFSLPLDMQYFRQTTLNHVVCMGENTLLSFPNAKPLKNRTNIVLSQDPSHNYEGVVNVHSFEEFLKKISEYAQNEKLFIIGGASIYRQTLPYVDEVHLTKVNADGGAEVFFTNLDEHPSFQLVQESDPVRDGDLEIKFTVYKNLNKKEILS